MVWEGFGGGKCKQPTTIVRGGGRWGDSLIKVGTDVGRVLGKISVYVESRISRGSKFRNLGMMGGHWFISHDRPY